MVVAQGSAVGPKKMNRLNLFMNGGACCTPYFVARLAGYPRHDPVADGVAFIYPKLDLPKHCFTQGPARLMFGQIQGNHPGHAAYVPGLTRTVRQLFPATYRSLPELRKQYSGEPRRGKTRASPFAILFIVTLVQSGKFGSSARRTNPT